jgi:ArsR family transcriptional regulator
MGGDVSQRNRIKTLSVWLKILSEPKRLAILDLLMQGVQCNCELGDVLDMAPNLISHHMNVLYEAGIVQAERDPSDARWVYYSIKREKLDEVTAVFRNFFDPERIQPRRPSCGPLVSSGRVNDVTVIER